MTLLGIIGEIRHPQYKKDIDNIARNIELDIISKYQILNQENPHLKEFLETQKTPYSNHLSYLEVSLKRLEKLEPLDFFLVSIESNDCFLLPDTSCFQVRGQLKEYFNPYIQEIIQIGIPLSNNIYMLATPQSLNSGMHGIKYVRNNDSELVYQINKDLYDFSRKAVACSNETYLKNFIDKISIENTNL